jgi:hypothetical protein
MTLVEIGCDDGCKKHVFHPQKDCCRARWLVGCFAKHAPAMLDRRQAQDAKILGKAKAIERRKAVVKMAKSLSKESVNEQ